MREGKAEELRNEAEAISHAHDRIVDRKDAAIQMLDKDLDDAEEQYRMAVRSHTELMDRLLDLQYARIRALEEEFNSNLENLRVEFDTERKEIENAHARQKRDLQDLIAAMDAEFNEQLAQVIQPAFLTLRLLSWKAR